MATDRMKRRRAPRPAHLRWSYIALVAAGGTLGTASRQLLTDVMPSWRGIPVVTIGINVLGAFALGVLVEALTRRGRDEGIRRTLRLLAGTGFLGGFTTYSALAVDTDVLFRAGTPWLAVGYAVSTVVLGAAAAAIGVAVAARQHRRQQHGRCPDSPGAGDRWS